MLVQCRRGAESRMHQRVSKASTLEVGQDPERAEPQCRNHPVQTTSGAADVPDNVHHHLCSVQAARRAELRDLERPELSKPA